MVVSHSEKPESPAGSDRIQSIASPAGGIRVVGEPGVTHQSWSGRGYRLPWFFCGRAAGDLNDSLDTGRREGTECEVTTWHTQASSVHLISCQPMSRLEMTMVPMEQEQAPERIRGGGCCNWGPSAAPKHPDDHPGLQIGQERPVTPRTANGKQSSSGKPNPATSPTKQQQNTRAGSVPGPSNSAQVPPKSSKAGKPPKPPKAPKAPKAPKPPKAPKTPKPAKAPPPPTRAASTPAQAPVKPVQGPSNPRKPSLKSAQEPPRSSQVPAESSHPIFPNLPSQLPERR